MTVREISANELLYTRSDGQFSKLYLAFPQPAVVFKALVNNPAIGTDQIVYVEYDTPGAYDYTDILPDMTLLIGSSDETYDLGIARIRKVASATKLFIGETSEVKFADNMFLTVIDEYGLWPRHKYVQEGSTHEDFMDFDVNYTTGANGQHATLDPVPIMGPDRVLFYQGTLAAHPGNSISIQMDASGSYCLSSSGAKTYLWTADTGTIDDDDIANPTIHFHAPGTHRVSCKVTIGGKSFTGRRIVMVYDNTALPVSNFKLNNCSGGLEDGGWNFKVTMYDDADLGLVRDRARCILFARDWYGDITTLTSTAISFDTASKKILKASGLAIFTKGMTIKVSGSTSNDGEYIITESNTAYLVVNKALVTEGAGDSVVITCLHGQKEISIGQIAGCENIVCSGWIDKEDINMNVQGGTVAFTVHGPHHWLNQMQGFISGLRYSATAPTEWNYMMGLTVNMGLWDILHWRSTATVCMDCFLTDDVKIIPTMESTSVGSLWEQLRGQAYETILANICCDRFGRLFVDVDGNLVPIGDRSFTNVITIESYDRTDDITVERVTVNPTGLVDISGVWFDGETGNGMRALSNGHIVNRYGSEEILDRLLFEDQDHCNELAGLIHAKKNNPYPMISIDMPSNMRLIDICPRQQITIVTDDTTNPREIEISDKSFPRRVSFQFNDTAKCFSVQIEAEPETTVVYNTITGEIPITTEAPSDTWVSPVGFLPWLPSFPMIPPMPPDPVLDVPDAGDCIDASPPTGPYNCSWDKASIWGDAVTESNRIAHAWFKGTIRSSAADHSTYIIFPVRSAGNSYQFLNLYGIDSSGAKVATGALTVMAYTEDYKVVWLIGSFDLASAVSIAAFELEIDTGTYEVGVPAIYDSISCKNRHGSTWLYPGGATVSLLIDESVIGYVKIYIYGHCAYTPHILGDEFQWEIDLHSAPATVGRTLIKTTWTATNGYMKDDKSTALINGAWSEYNAGPNAGNVGIYFYAGGDTTDFIIAGTFEVLYVGTSTGTKSCGLGPAEIYNVCPAT
jgi:hypothetical protein